MDKIKNFLNKYAHVANTSYDDQFFAEKYGHLGITTRKEWFIWKTEFPDEFEDFKKKTGGK